MADFDKLNRETRDYNNGITRNIDPTSRANCKISASQLLKNFNNYTYHRNNGQYSKHYM